MADKNDTGESAQLANTVLAAQAAGAALAPPQIIDAGVPYTVIPDGYHVEDLEAFADRPARVKAEVVCETTEAFVAYFNRFVSPAASTIFASTAEFVLEGVIDWHKPASSPLAAGEDDRETAPLMPAFADHRVIYRAPRADEWTVWTGANKTQMTQEVFAQFIEDNLADIREPAGADILEIANRLEAQKKVEFVSAQRLTDGAREFTYNETVEGSTRKGTMKIPETFTLGIPVFFGGDLYQVTARLRYRIGSGQLMLWYDLLNPQRIEQDAFEKIVDTVDQQVDAQVLRASRA